MPSIGAITQIIGPIVDVSFEKEAQIPAILNALEVTKADGQKIILECQQQLGESIVRCIAMDASRGSYVVCRF
jgi:F-type H+-transporting ATPase subunit beta